MPSRNIGLISMLDSRVTRAQQAGYFVGNICVGRCDAGLTSSQKRDCGSRAGITEPRGIPLGPPRSRSCQPPVAFSPRLTAVLAVRRCFARISGSSSCAPRSSQRAPHELLYIAHVSIDMYLMGHAVSALHSRVRQSPSHICVTFYSLFCPH